MRRARRSRTSLQNLSLPKLSRYKKLSLQNLLSVLDRPAYCRAKRVLPPSEFCRSEAALCLRGRGAEEATDDNARLIAGCVSYNSNVVIGKAQDGMGALARHMTSYAVSLSCLFQVTSEAFRVVVF